jgi:PhnB protein
MVSTNAYLNFPGTAEAAFGLYKKTFGGEFAMIMRFGDVPPSENVPAEAGDKIMHIALPLGGGTMLMGSDVVGSMAEGVVQGNNVYISVSATSREEADQVFASLAEGGKTEMPMGDTFWGSYFGMCEDAFGIHWMVGYDAPKEG